REQPPDRRPDPVPFRNPCRRVALTRNRIRKPCPQLARCIVSRRPFPQPTILEEFTDGRVGLMKLRKCCTDKRWKISAEWREPRVNGRRHAAGSACAKLGEVQQR